MEYGEGREMEKMGVNNGYGTLGYKYVMYERKYRE